MTPAHFPQVTAFFGPPPGLAESQVQTIPAFVGTVQRGSVEGTPIVVTAWQPSPEDLVRLNAGAPLFLTFLGGLPPHMVKTSFNDAINPA